MNLGFVARSCWPAVGGIEQHIRTLSGALGTTHQIRLFAHRIDNDGTQWKGPLDRSDPFRSFVDPLTGVTTVQLRLTQSDLRSSCQLARPPKLLSASRIAETSRAKPLNAESWGLVVSEAWSYGVPVVTSNIPVLHERLTECKGGLAVPATPRELADALEKLLRNDALRREMGMHGHNHWRTHLTPEAVAGWHRAAYEELTCS